jgi:hypothetical protein
MCLIEQSRQDKSLLYRHNKPDKPTKERPFHLSSSCLSFESQQGPPLSSISGRNTNILRAKFKYSQIFYVCSPLLLCKMVSSTNLHQYTCTGALHRETKCSPTSPIQLNVTYSIGWSKRKKKGIVSKMAAKFRDKRTLITRIPAP